MTVRLTFAAGSGKGTNTWHIRSTAIPVPPAPSITNVIKNFYSSIALIFPTSMSFAWDGTLFQVDTTTPSPTGGMTAWTIPGSGGSSNYGPAGVGADVCWHSSLATRRGRGRTFLSPMLASVLTGDGTLLDANRTQIVNAANTLCTASQADGNGAVSVWSPSDHVGRDVLTATVPDRVAWLSSRRG